MEVYKKISLKPDKYEHLYIQLASQLELLIDSGDLKSHTKLPPIRKFSALLDVNKSIVVKAYKILEEKGLIYKKPGSGTYVDESNTLKESAHNNYIEYSMDMINLASGTPSEDLFPVKAFKKSLNYVLDVEKGHAFGYGDSKGDLGLRKSIIRDLLPEGLQLSINQLQIVSGAQQGIDIVSKALLSSKDYVMVEAPTYTGALAIFKSRGCRFIEIPLDHQGIDFEIMEKKLRKYRPKVFFTMPNLHNPTGYTYSLEEKKKLLRLAARFDFYIIEDDYSSELNFTNKSNETLVSLDQNDRVIYIKSLSKIFLPGLRLGYLIAPNAMETAITNAKHTTDISTSGLIQKTFKHFVVNGQWAIQRKKISQIVKEKFDLSVLILEKNLPKDFKFYKPYGGVNFWIECEESIDLKDLIEFLNNNNYMVAPGHLFYLNKKVSKYFRLSIASLELEDLESALINFCQVLSSFNKTNSTSKTIPIL